MDQDNVAFSVCANCLRTLGVDGAPITDDSGALYCGPNCLQSKLLDVNNTRFRGDRYRRRKEARRNRKHNEPTDPDIEPLEPPEPPPQHQLNAAPPASAPIAVAVQPRAAQRARLFSDSVQDDGHALFVFHAYHCGAASFRQRSAILAKAAGEV